MIDIVGHFTSKENDNFFTNIEPKILTLGDQVTVVVLTERLTHAQLKIW